jgi:small subunit ribosomal protein S1
MDDENMMGRNEGIAEDMSENEMARYLDEPDHALRPVKRGEVVEGTIVAIDREEILVDIGLKSEAVLPLKELFTSGYGSLDELHINDTILVYVLQPETPEGHAVVSIRKARQEHQWRVAQEMYERGDIIDAEVIESNKGGLIVNLSGVRGFVPISQIMNLKREDSADNAETQAKLQAMVSKTLKLKIIEINRNRNRLILSERLAMQEWRARRRDELLNELQVNEVRRGVVSNLAHFGAFVDLGGADGLVHISQLAWSRVNHPSEVLHIGQEVEVQVLSIDKERKKIALSIKRAEIDPWVTVEQRYQVGQVVTGTVTKLAPFGAFARIENGIEGLIHISEIWPPTSDVKASLKEGQEVQVRILRIESDRRRLGLSMKAVAAPDVADTSEDAVAKIDEAYDAADTAESVPQVATVPETVAQQTPAPEAAPLPPPPPPVVPDTSLPEPTTAIQAALQAAMTRQQNGHITPQEAIVAGPDSGEAEAR